MKLNSSGFHRRLKRCRTRVHLTLGLTCGLILYLKCCGVFTVFFTRDFNTEFTYPLEGDVVKYVRQVRAGLEPEIAPINSYDYPFVIFNESKCLAPNGNLEKIQLLILVKSSLKHRVNRGAIRRTWGQENQFANTNIRLAFLLGKPADNYHLQNLIELEHKTYGDIIQSDFIDAYYNNTIKTMQGIRWVVEKCSSAEFILFSDDDMYISVKNLLSFLESFDNRQKGSGNVNLNDDTKHLFAGSVFQVSPVRNVFSKWYISVDEYPFSEFPSFINAGAFVLSYEVLVQLFYGSMFTKHIRFDDVFLGLVAYKLNISLTNNDEFYNWKVNYRKDKYQKVIAVHGYGDPFLLTKIWTEQRNLNNA